MRVWALQFTLFSLLVLLLLASSASAKLIVGTNGRDHLHGTKHSDTIFLGRGGGWARAGKGKDTILVGSLDRHAPKVRVYGGRGRDDIRTGGGNDLIKAGAGNDVVFGGFGNDRIVGGTGRDDLHAQNGNDIVLGKGSKDHVTASSGNDLVKGGAGRDALTGGPEDDVVHGNGGDDAIHLYLGNDRGYGGPGYDWLGGYLGNDTLVGGSGIDIGADGFGHNLIQTEYGRHAALPGHPIYKPHDDRHGKLPHLRGHHARALRRAIIELRQTKAIHSWDERDQILAKRSRLFHAARHELEGNFNGIKHRGFALLKLLRLQAAYSAEVDRLTLDLQFG